MAEAMTATMLAVVAFMAITGAATELAVATAGTVLSSGQMVVVA